MVPNRPSQEGAEGGRELARLTEHAFAELRQKFPDHAEPCPSCAFRRGTVPNRCLPTVMDAIKCVVEQTPFLCHQPTKGCKGLEATCTGWLIAISAVHDKPPGKVPWKFSHEDDA